MNKPYSFKKISWICFLFGFFIESLLLAATADTASFVEPISKSSSVGSRDLSRSNSIDSTEGMMSSFESLKKESENAALRAATSSPLVGRKPLTRRSRSPNSSTSIAIADSSFILLPSRGSVDEHQKYEIMLGDLRHPLSLPLPLQLYAFMSMPTPTSEYVMVPLGKEAASGKDIFVWINRQDWMGKLEKVGSNLNVKMYTKLKKELEPDKKIDAFFVKLYLDAAIKESFEASFLALLAEATIAPNIGARAVSAAVTALFVKKPGENPTEFEWVNTVHGEVVARVLREKNQIMIRYGKPLGKGSFKTVYPAIRFFFLAEGEVRMEGREELVVMSIGGNKDGARNEAAIHKRFLHANIMPPCNIEYNTDSELELSQLRSRGELKDYLKTQTTATYRAAVVQAAWEAAQGLAYIHKQGYIYRDFKPENILHGLLGSKDKPQSMLCDFGLTIHLEKAEIAPVEGTSLYLPPEEKNSPAMDTWAFGVSLYELLSPEAHYPPQIRTENRRFTDRADIDQAMFAGWGQELDPTDAALRTLILQLLSKNPEERPTAQGIMEILFELVRH